MLANRSTELGLALLYVKKVLGVYRYVPVASASVKPEDVLLQSSTEHSWASAFRHPKSQSGAAREQSGAAREHSGTELDPLIPVPDWFRHLHFPLVTD